MEAVGLGLRGERMVAVQTAGLQRKQRALLISLDVNTEKLMTREPLSVLALGVLFKTTNQHAAKKILVVAVQ